MIYPNLEKAQQEAKKLIIKHVVKRTKDDLFEVLPVEKLDSRPEPEDLSLTENMSTRVL